MNNTIRAPVVNGILENLDDYGNLSDEEFSEFLTQLDSTNPDTQSEVRLSVYVTSVGREWPDDRYADIGDSDEEREAYEAARVVAHVDALACIFPEPQHDDEDNPADTIADLIEQSDADAILGRPSFDAEIAEAGWSRAEAAHRGRRFGLQQVLEKWDREQLAGLPTESRKSEPEPAAPIAPQSDLIPAHLLSPGGFLGRVMDWTLSQSYKPQPELALAASIILLSTLTGRKIRNARGTRTNLYAIGVAASGAGKDDPRKCLKKLLVATAIRGILSEGAVSGQGLLSALRVNPVHCIAWDEFGLVLQAIGDKNAGPHLRSITSNLLRLFTSSGGVFAGESRADMTSEAAAAIVEPHLTIFGTTTPETLYSSVDELAVTSGLFGRMLFVHALPGYIEPNLDLVEADPPQDLVDEVLWWSSYTAGTGNLSALSSQPRTVATDATAEASYRKWILARDRASSAAGGWQQSLLVRAGELASKLILLHAVSLDRQATVAGIESVEWACQLTDFLLGRLVRTASAKVSSNPYERLQNDLIEYIASKGASGATSSDLSLKFKKVKAKDRKEALEHAKESGRVTDAIRPSKGGRASVVYFAAT